MQSHIETHFDRICHNIIGKTNANGQKYVADGNLICEGTKTNLLTKKNFDHIEVICDSNCNIGDYILMDAGSFLHTQQKFIELIEDHKPEITIFAIKTHASYLPNGISYANCLDGYQPIDMIAKEVLPALDSTETLTFCFRDDIAKQILGNVSQALVDAYYQELSIVF